MIFTGQELVKKRNFYTQNGNFGITVDFSVDNPSGRYEFGVSGTESVSLILQSGKITWNNLFVQSYLPFNDYSVLLEITDSSLNYIQNNQEVFYGLSKNTGDYNYFYFKRENTGINSEFDFSVSGKNLPNYNIDKLGIWFNSGQTEVTGSYTNQSGYDIRIFSSFAQDKQGLAYNFSTGFFSSGALSKFKYSGDFSDFDFTQPITTTFYTNFGTQQIKFKILNTATLEKFVLLDEITDYSFNNEDLINRTITWTNYSGGVAANNFNTDLFLSLEYVNGSGQFTVDDFAASASFTGLAYGNFLQSGLVTGLAQIATGTDSVTGVYSVNFTRFQWATGRVTGYFSGNGTGMASGINYTGLAHGPFTGSLTGTIRNGSGTLFFDNIHTTGFLVGEAYTVNYTGYVNATGYINISGLPYNSIFYIGVENIPIVKGLQYYNETGLAYYLSGTAAHKVFAKYEDNIIKLESRVSGADGNGIFIKNYSCGATGLTLYTPFLTGGGNIGTTGNVVYGLNQPFSGIISTTATGSGNYVQFASGNEVGNFTFTRTFTGSWDLYTGLIPGALMKVAESSSIISGRANLSSNSYLIFEVGHSDSDFNTETARLTISGSDIINPIQTLISQ
jgi:hypothetical protein